MKKLNGFNDGLHRSSGVGGKNPSDYDQPKTKEKKVEYNKFFYQWVIDNNSMHPIEKLFIDAMYECEKLPASEQQTATIMAIQKCKDEVEQQLELLYIITSNKTSFKI